jgi:hypothetical protein
MFHTPNSYRYINYNWGSSINDVAVLGGGSEIYDMPYDFWEVSKKKTGQKRRFLP